MCIRDRPRAGNRSRKYAGYFEINVTVKEGRTPEEVEQFVLEEIDKLREGEITEYELQKVKNQVLSSSVRRLKNNMGLMFQLGVYDTWLDWSYINQAPQRMLQVTADDVRRVVKEYFDAKVRTVAIYRTKEGAPSDEDSELAALIAGLPPEAQGQVKQMLDQIKRSTNLDQLSKRLQMMEQIAGSPQMPEDQKAMLDYTIKMLKERMAELEAARKELD